MYAILLITLPIFSIIALGYAMVRFGLFAKPEMRVMGRFVINLALPALVFKALSERPIAEIANSHYLLAYALGSLTVMGLMAGTARFLRKKPLEVSAILGIGVSMSNSGFIGYPIVSQFLGPPAAVALALCMVVENVIVLPLTLVMAESGVRNGGRLRSVLPGIFLGLLKNPLILAILAGFACALLEARPPRPIARAIEMIAMASSPLALVVIGGTLVGLELKGMIGDIAQVVVGKLLLHPLAVCLAFLLLPSVDPQLRNAGIAFAAMPMLSIYPIVALKYGLESFCAAVLLAATVSAFFTISAVLWLLGGFPG